MKQKGTSAKMATMTKLTPMTNHLASNAVPNLGLAVSATELCTNKFSRNFLTKTEWITRSFIRNYSPYEGTTSIRRDSIQSVKQRADGFTLGRVFLHQFAKPALVAHCSTSKFWCIILL
jgi:hypothetical protein